jgi:hypothetical protein
MQVYNWSTLYENFVMLIAQKLKESLLSFYKLLFLIARNTIIIM